jgi:hypothetical protein
VRSEPRLPGDDESRDEREDDDTSGGETGRQPAPGTKGVEQRLSHDSRTRRVFISSSDSTMRNSGNGADRATWNVAIRKPFPLRTRRSSTACLSGPTSEKATLLVTIPPFTNVASA